MRKLLLLAVILTSSILLSDAFIYKMPLKHLRLPIYPTTHPSLVTRKSQTLRNYYDNVYIAEINIGTPPQVVYGTIYYNIFMLSVISSSNRYRQFRTMDSGS